MRVFADCALCLFCGKVTHLETPATLPRIPGLHLSFYKYTAYMLYLALAYFDNLCHQPVIALHAVTQDVLFYIRTVGLHYPRVGLVQI